MFSLVLFFSFFKEGVLFVLGSSWQIPQRQAILLLRIQQDATDTELLAGLGNSIVICQT